MKWISDRLRQITFCIAYNKLKKKNKIIKIFEIKTKECFIIYKN